MAESIHNTVHPPQVELRIFLLGSFRVCMGRGSSDGRTWRLRKAVTMLQILSMTPGHHLHRDQLIDLLWPDTSPETAYNKFHQVLYIARRNLEELEPRVQGTDILKLNRHIVSLGVQGQVWTDVRAFEHAARRATATGTIADFNTAIECYTGDLLENEPYEDRFINHREALRREFHRMLLGLSTLYLEHGDVGYAISVLERLLAKDPTLEEAHVRLMQLYATAGLRYQAVAQYHALRSALHDEFAILPSPTSRKLYEAIVDGSFSTDRTVHHRHPSNRAIVTNASHDGPPCNL